MATAVGAAVAVVSAGAGAQAASASSNNKTTFFIAIIVTANECHPDYESITEKGKESDE